jgi:hypothetical protein
MQIILSAFVSLALLAGLAGGTAAPAAAEKAYYAKKKKYPRYRAYRTYGPTFTERWADKLPIGTSAWWQQMDREQRGGRR